MKHGDIVHDMILEHLQRKLSRTYREIFINKRSEQTHEYKGYYPDMILGNSGMVLNLLEVETQESISERQAEKWEQLSGLGAKLILMIPKDKKVRVTELLWAKGLMQKISIGTYEISINMP
jgi:hypothetical protein